MNCAIVVEFEGSQKFDVAIVGFGPTGATLANLLAQCGVSVVILDREAEMYHLPRAVHFDGETMRVFQTVGIADELSKKVRINPGMRFVDPEGNMLLDWPRPPELGPQGWHASYRLHQPDLEKLLRKKIEKHTNVCVLTGTEVISACENEDSVEINCRTTEGGCSTMVQASYLVGCDGARSLLRGVIGSEMDDLGFEERWLVVDVLLKRERPDLGDHTLQFCDPVRPMTYCRSPGIRRRWEITVLDAETDAEVAQEDRIWEFLAPWITPDDADLERSAIYTFRSAVAKRWRKGCIMIAGDAAHLTPPFMGQGMCAGIRDAANLAWKLALCVSGRAGSILLDSYQNERKPNAATYIKTATRLGGLINTLDRGGALKQTEENVSGVARMASITPALGPPSKLAAIFEDASPHFGKLFSQPTLTNGQLLDDRIGYAPVLIVRRPLPKGARPTMTVLDADNHPHLATALDKFSTNALLVRPDRYIAAAATSEVDIEVLSMWDFPSPIAKIQESDFVI